MATAAKEKASTTAPAEKTVVSASSYATTDGNEALRYTQVGGKLVSVVKLFPNNPLKPGKRFTFLETKAQLDELVARQQEEA